MPFGSNRRESDSERFIRRNSSTRTVWASVPLVRPVPRSCLPLVPFRTDPPNRPSVVGFYVIGRDVAVLGRMPLRGEFGMRLRQRLESRLRDIPFPARTHGRKSCHTRCPPRASFPSPLQDLGIPWDVNPRVALVSLRLPWAIICRAYSPAVWRCANRRSSADSAIPGWFRTRSSGLRPRAVEVTRL